VVGSSVRYTPAAAFVGIDSFSYTVADGQGGEASAVVNVTVNAPPSVHVGDIDAFPSRQPNKWSVRLRFTVHSQTDATLQNVVVEGRWDTGATMGCTTNRFGYCEVSLIGIALTVPSRTFTIERVNIAGRVYIAASNHDPEKDSDGTTIVVNRP
jgi:hypothetical protein